jgi:hypothetical protein
MVKVRYEIKNYERIITLCSTGKRISAVENFFTLKKRLYKKKFPKILTGETGQSYTLTLSETRPDEYDYIAVFDGRNKDGFPKYFIEGHGLSFYFCADIIFLFGDRTPEKIYLHLVDDLVVFAR